MKAQEPAEGILKQSDFGDSKYYQIVCSCGQEYHSHSLEVEADETGVNVNISVSPKTDYWSELVAKRYDIDNPWAQEVDWAVKDLINGIWTRIKLTWQIWLHGYVCTETTIALTEQQALNYAETQKTAIADVKAFRAPKARQTRTFEGDCV